MDASKHRVFASFLLSHILILLIPLLVGSLALSEAERVVRTYATETNLSILEQTKDILDARTAEIKKMATLLALSPRVRSLADAKSPISNATYYAIWEMRRDLQPYQLTETFVTSFFIYFKNLDMIVSPYTAYPISSLYGHSFQYSNLSEAQWKYMLFNRHYAGEFLPVTPARYEGNNYSIIPYIQSLPMEQTDRSNAAIIMLIDAMQIRRLLQRVKVYDQGWVYIADPQGRIITAVVGDRARAATVAIQPDRAIFSRRITGNPMTVINTASSYNGWRYVAVLPSTAIMGRVRYIRNLALGVAILSLFIGIVAAYYLAYQNIKPLKEIVRSLTGLFDGNIDRGGTEYEVLRGTLSAIGTIMTDNRSLRFNVEKQRPLLKAAVMDSLLKGRYTDPLEIDSALSHVGWSVNGRSFAAMIIRVTGYEASISPESLTELDYIKAFIQDNLTATAFSETYLHHLDRGRFVVILGSDISAQADFLPANEIMITKLMHNLLDKYGIKVLCALGNVCDSLLRISASYEQACQAADYQTIKNNADIAWYSTLPSASVRYYYPIDLEEHLIHLARVGDKQAVRKLLDSVYQENLLNRKLSVDMIQQLLYELRGTTNKVMDERISGELKQQFRDKLNNSDNIDEFFKNMTALFTTICEHVVESSRKDKKGQIDRIINFIKLNYKDAELSLSTVAAQFKLSSAYLSQIFKEEAGENFSDYLEKTRLERASELLADPGLSVSEIATQLGYNSDKAFRRAFKRVNGLSPSDFRKTTLQDR